MGGSGRFCEQRFARVRKPFARSLASGDEVGACFCITVDGPNRWNPRTLYDWEKVTALLAAQALAWKPGTESGYHSMTQGHLVGEVVRRITGRSLGTVFREELAEPLGADFHIGLPATEDGRVADWSRRSAGPMALCTM